jgi:hypothetical protein
MPNYVNEASAMTVRARFYNYSNDLATPGTIRYLIKDLTNDRVVRDWTSVTPDSDVNIVIEASDNNLYTHTRKRKRFERRVITVQANAGEENQHSQEVEYWVRNLYGIDSDD